jgi:iron complex outermembrane receptor protein
MSRISRTFSSFLYVSTALTGTALAGTAFAQVSDKPAEAAAEAPSEIVVTGTRGAGRIAADSATPIQLVGEGALSKVGQPNLNQALTQLVPSFQAQTQGTDMASFSLSARLRGLSPNHTLIMVNGKRRHGNSILQVINGAFGGSAAPSIDLIPPDIVQRIEILQDGAAAQYGTDAIAGVINIILKNDSSGVTLKSSAGQYYDGGGRQYSASGNIGLPVGDNGYLDISLFHRRNAVTTLGKGLFAIRNLDGAVPTDVPAGFQPVYASIISRNADVSINGGQPKSQLNVGFYNFGYDFGDIEVYSFGDVSHRHGDALQGYRVPRRICDSASGAGTNPALCLQSTVTNGLVPHIEVKQQEFSTTNGVKGSISEWNWDLGLTYGYDKAKVYTTGSANASLYLNDFNAARDKAILGGATLAAANATAATFANATAPDYFYDGSFKFTQLVGTLDITKQFDVGLANELNLALGGEYRKEDYDLTAGDALSRYVEGGQSFPGYALSDAFSLKRNVKAGYIDVAVKPVDAWSVDLAGRIENYSDVGTTTIGKITSRYDFSPAFAIRGTASTGFRAPSLQESGYSSTSVGPTSATLQLPASSAAAASAGFSPLKPEKSTNFSIGGVFRPVPKLVISLDGYYIKVKDRIVSSGGVTGQNQTPIGSASVGTCGYIPGVNSPCQARVLTPLINGLTPYQLVQNAIAASGKQLDPSVLSNGSLAIQTFTNGIDTRTMGLELSARYPVDLSFGKLDLLLSANYNKTKVTKSRLGTLFNSNSIAVIEKASPDFKSVASALFTTGGFSANLRATYYSKTTQLVQPNSLSNNIPGLVGTAPRPIADIFGGPGYYEGVVKAAVIFDLELGYDVTKHFNIAVGSNNLLNKKPEIPPYVADFNAASPNLAWRTATRSPYINNGGVIGGPYTFGPYGSAGGYYYARVTFKF